MITRTQLLGAWSLESYTEADVQSGEVSYPMGRNPEGLILYTSDGYMSAQLSSDGRDRFRNQDPYGGSSEEYIAAAVTSRTVAASTSTRAMAGSSAKCS